MENDNKIKFNNINFFNKILVLLKIKKTAIKNMKKLK